MKSRIALMATCVLASSTLADSSLAQSRCPVELDFRSINSRHQTSMTFRNASGSQRQLYWIDFNGQRVLYATLQPGQDFAINTYVSHPWVSTNAAGDCVAVYYPDMRARQVSLTD